MAIQTTYTSARANLAKLMDEVTDHNEVVIIQRRGAEDVALISASELTGLLETAHLLRSPKNAERLLTALREARTHEEQLDLAQEIWEHASPSADFSLSDELKELLEARLLEARSNPEAGISWEEVKARLLRRA